VTDPTRILLIDDDAVDRMSVRRALKQAGLAHEVAEAPDGATGLRLARAQTFDCVLLDFRLPDVDTYELLAALLAPDGGSQAVVMLTGEADQEVALRLMRAGALDYLAKADATPSSLARAIRYAKARRGFVAELEMARRDAEEKSRALDTLNRQQALLLSIIAHDLRNPFQVILGFSTALSRTVAAKDYASLERRSQAISAASQRAYALMESLFSWASLQMDTVAVTLSDVDLSEVMEEIASGAADPAADKAVSVKTDCPKVRVRAHRGMLAAVLRNLVNNAVKFTHSGGTVTISARPCDAGIEVSVTDNGIGIPPETVADLFRLDRRTTTSGTAGELGSGLGLLLCRDLVERQGSVLDVESVVGKGTTFHFTLAEAGP
jgi:signal transduction histidine kinase